MSKFCDRSPCSALMAQLGRTVFGEPGTGSFVFTAAHINGAVKPVLITILYCPFCGHRLETLEFKAGDELTLVR